MVVDLLLRVADCGDPSVAWRFSLGVAVGSGGVHIGVVDTGDGGVIGANLSMVSSVLNSW